MNTRTKSLALAIKSAGAPSEEQLAAIRQYTLADIAADQLYVRTFVIAHNAIDRDGEAFDESLLADFARTLPGKGLYIKHPSGWDGDSGPAEGRWFGARTERMAADAARTLLREPTLALPPDRTEAVLLLADAYIVRTPDNASLLAKIDAGIAGDVSIGFQAAARTRMTDAAGRELNAWRLSGPGEALEASLVWLGAQPGARAIKNANRNTENPMDLQQQLDAAKAEVSTLKAAQAEHAKAASSLAALKAALGDNAVLLDAPATLAEVVSAGKDYRANLIDTIVIGERHKGTIGDADADVQTAKAAYAELPVAKLKTLAGLFGTKADKPGIAGGDPNGGAPGGAALTKGHVFNNPLVGAAPAAA